MLTFASIIPIHPNFLQLLLMIYFDGQLSVANSISNDFHILLKSLTPAL